MAGKKRLSSEKNESQEADAQIKRPSSTILGISRSISACQRCRIKKIRCDQSFPKCSKCEKAKVECVGLDPATGREVPRSYVIHLEDRIALLETTLKKHGIDPDTGNVTSKISGAKGDITNDPGNNNGFKDKNDSDSNGSATESKSTTKSIEDHDSLRYAEDSMNNKSVKMEPTDSHSSQFAPTSGISFAKLMFTAVKLQNSSNSQQQELILDPSTPKSLTNVLPALLPSKSTAQEFMKVYFAQSNSQLPVLHREEFVRTIFMPIYGKIDQDVSLASNYTAINNTLFESNMNEEDTWYYQYERLIQQELQSLKQQGKSVDAIQIYNSLKVPSKFHIPLYFLNIIFAIASSVHHLQYASTISCSFKAAAIKYIEPIYSSPDRLKALQGILLLSLYSIMRPADPGVWYVLGSALRVCVDLSLHNETRMKDLDAFTKDLRRRLFWCTYSLDRQICVYLGRPFGIPEESINTSFPTELDDTLIIRNDQSTNDYSRSISGMPTYKVVSLSMFKIRQLQAEVQRILYERTEIPRRFVNLDHWKSDISKRLQAWKLSSPKTQRKMNCDFNLEFFRLNFNHTQLMLHGLSPKNLKLSLDDFNIVSDAAKEVIDAYHNLHINKRINYTWVAVHNLFMSGTSYLYAIYNNEAVRMKNSINEVKKVSQACINVLTCLIDRCDAALSCRDTFETLTAAVIKLRYNESVSGNVGIVHSHEIDRTQAGGHLSSNLQNLVQNINEETNYMIQQQNLSYYTANNNNNENTQNSNINENMSMHNSSQEARNQQSFSANKFPSETFQYNQNSFSGVPSKYQVPPPSQQYNHSSSVSKFEWISNNENDLDTFFHELENLSPMSFSKEEDHSNANTPIATGSSNQANIQSYNQTQGSPAQFIPQPNIQYNIPQAQGQGSSQNNNYNQMAIPGPTIKIDSQNNKLNQLDLNTTYPSTRDGQKVFEMIFQVPAESIWDQFFTTSYQGNSILGPDFGAPPPTQGSQYNGDGRYQ